MTLAALAAKIATRDELEALLIEQAGEADALRADAERYRWLRENPTWLGYDADYRPDEIDSAVDREMKVPNGTKLTGERNEQSE